MEDSSGPYQEPVSASGGEPSSVESKSSLEDDVSCQTQEVNIDDDDDDEDTLSAGSNIEEYMEDRQPFDSADDVKSLAERFKEVEIYLDGPSAAEPTTTADLDKSASGEHQCIEASKGAISKRSARTSRAGRRMKDTTSSEPNTDTTTTSVEKRGALKKSKSKKHKTSSNKKSPEKSKRSKKKTTKVKEEEKKEMVVKCESEESVQDSDCESLRVWWEGGEV